MTKVNMVRRCGVFCAALLGQVLLLGCGTESSARIDPALPSMNSRTVGSQIAGNFSNAPQAKANPQFQDVRLHLRPIWLDRIDGLWLYVEQALAATPDAPYRQRIYQIVDGNDADSVECRIYALPGDAKQYAGQWKVDRPMRMITADLLLPIGGCTISLAKGDDGSWSGATQSGECRPPETTGITSTTMLKVGNTGLEVWDRSFDASGAQVGGSTVGPYLFVRE